MESLVALGLAANAVQFIDFTAKVLALTHRIYQNRSLDGDYQELGDLQQLSLRIVEHARPIEVQDPIRHLVNERALQKRSTDPSTKPTGRNPLIKVVHTFKSLHYSPEEWNDSQDQLDAALVTRLRACDKQIIKICCGCEEIALELQATIERLQNSNHSAWKSFSEALKSVWGEEKIQHLRVHLSEHRAQLTFLLIASAR